MCLLCVEIQKQNMKPIEIARAFMEITDNDHAEKVAEIIAEDKKLFDQVREELIALNERRT